LSDRRGRALGYDDITEYRKILEALAATDDLMDEIDEAIEEFGGLPLT
jgi:hypothetical protein